MAEISSSRALKREAKQRQRSSVSEAAHRSLPAVETRGGGGARVSGGMKAEMRGEIGVWGFLL